jgi:EAL domain-containing protein (putative c-di-GMP-specific phosphodiesterase class I)/CheY-like chemotaxis protein
VIEPSTIKILLLDDDDFMLKLLSSMLRKMDFTSVTTFDNGHDALKQVDDIEKRPDLILLDLNMPEMDGIEFVRYLVERDYTGSLILVSGEDERMLQSTEKLVSAHKIPMLGYLLKPVKPDALLALLKQWVPPSQQTIPQASKKIYSREELQTAITQNELVNYYQPKVAVTTGELIGVETLVRWHHPVDGLVGPDLFIGVAEAHGLINDLTRLVLTNALQQASIWHQSGLELRVAINVSMNNLASLDFQDLVVDLTAKAGVSPQKVVLEVTESQLMGDSRVPLEILTRLRLKRFHLSIDDFGTGNSSLAQLRDIPFDELKIDQGFVHGAWADETLKAMYDASLSLARQLDIEVVVAEGVADIDDWNFLRHTGCDLAQGHFISRPMKPADFSAWLENWKKRIEDKQVPIDA